MAVDNLKDFGIQWALMGMLFLSMLSFVIMFIATNNPNGLGDYSTNFNDGESSITSRLTSLESSTNSLLNISSESNPEVSDLGSKDSVATSYGITGSAKNFFSSIKIFMSWVLIGTTGEIIISVFGGIFGLISLYFITKWIRQGA